MFIIAVHGGAGNHSSNKAVESQIKKGLKEACICAQSSFRHQQDICLAVRDSIAVLEDDVYFNAGTGSNLTIDGAVECDASIMNAAEDFGAVGALKGIKNPINAAYNILAESQISDKYGRIHPMILANAPDSSGMASVEHSTMVTPRTLSEWERWRMVIRGNQTGQVSPDDTTIQDTVGAIACTIEGDVAAGVSSGGLLLKYPGRIGEAGTFGAGCWASGASVDLNAVACSISGAGEMVMRAFLARELAEAVRQPDCDMHEEIERTLTKFKEMCSRRGSEHANAGVILLVIERQDDGVLKPRLWCGFTTASFAIAYTTSIESAPKAIILRRLGQSKNSPGLYITSLPLS